MTEICLSGNAIAKVDDADVPLLDSYIWSVEKSGGKEYAVCYLDPSDLTKCIRMHRLIMNPQPHEVVDHVDGDGLNNQRSNLRVCSQRENSRNICKTRGRSKYNCVFRCSDRDK